MPWVIRNKASANQALYDATGRVIQNVCCPPKQSRSPVVDGSSLSDSWHNPGGRSFPTETHCKACTASGAIRGQNDRLAN